LNFFLTLKQKAKELKSEAQVLVIAFRDSRTPLSAKILIGITVGYLLSPVDLIPDFIPVLGILDDLILVPLLIALSIKLIPVKILEEARHRAKLFPQSLKKTNWAFGIVIIILWIMMLYFIFRGLE